MSDEYRIEETPEGIIIFTMTRPEKLNALPPETTEALREQVMRLGDQPELRALVIAAEGRFFTAGIDIARLPHDRGVSGVGIRRDYRRFHLLMDEMEAVEKPIVLAAQGPCLGVGVEIASSVDFRFAAESAYFALPEIASLGVIPGSGGISRFTRIVGPHWARWVAIANQRVSAEQAVTIGFVHQVFPDDVFQEKVLEFTTALVGFSVEAIGLAKLAIDAAWDGDKINARNVDRMANTLLFKTAEYSDSVIAFTEASKAREEGRKA
jgi:enoyl-CoA hydratase/carnithine racemase